MEEKLLILYATQTGNAMDAAERIGREADRRGFLSSLFSIDQFDPVFLSLSLSLSLPVWHNYFVLLDR